MTRESQILLHCARTRLVDTDRASLDQLLRGEVDWSFLMALGERHGMLPLLARHLQQAGSGMPSDVRERLRRQQLRNSARVLRISTDLVAVLERFEAAGIPAAAYKGPVLAVHAYGDATLRTAGDLDVVVRRGDVARARSVLRGLGFESWYALSPANEHFRLSQRYSEEFVRGDVTVDLHWAFANRDVRFPVDLDALMTRLHRVPVAGGHAPTFALEDLLLILCVHGAKHRWDRLEWLCSIAELVRSAPAVDWQAVEHRAASLRSSRTLLLGLLLAHDLLAAPVPAHLLAAAREKRWIGRLAADVARRLVEPDSMNERAPDLLSRNLFQLPLQERGADRVRYLVYRLTTPNRPLAWRTLTVGTVMLPLHVATWPVQLVGRLLTQGWRRWRPRATPPRALPGVTRGDAAPTITEAASSTGDR